MLLISKRFLGMFNGQCLCTNFGSIVHLNTKARKGFCSGISKPRSNSLSIKKEINELWSFFFLVKKIIDDYYKK